MTWNIQRSHTAQLLCWSKTASDFTERLLINKSSDPSWTEWFFFFKGRSDICNKFSDLGSSESEPAVEEATGCSIIHGEGWKCSTHVCLPLGSLSLNTLTAPRKRNWHVLSVYSNSDFPEDEHSQEISSCGHHFILHSQRYLLFSVRISSFAFWRDT